MLGAPSHPVLLLTRGSAKLISLTYANQVVNTMEIELGEDFG